MSTASVRSVEAIQDLRAALGTFGEEAGGALGAVDMEIRRTLQWLTIDQKAHWVGEIKKRREKVAIARAELAKRRLSAINGGSAHNTEQKENLEKAERRLEDAEKRQAMIKKWEPKLQQAVLEYKSQARRLNDLIGGDLPRSAAFLDRVLNAIEAYTSLAPPSSLRPAGGGDWSAASVAAPAETATAEAVAEPVAEEAR